MTQHLSAAAATSQAAADDTMNAIVQDAYGTVGPRGRAFPGTKC